MLFYEKKGTGECVVLIHGFTLDCRMWDDQFELLSKSYHVIRFDQRGHGKSEGVFEDFNQVEDLKGLLETLNVDRTHIVGLSMGGYVATTFAIEYPEMVQALVIVDSVVTFNPSHEFYKRVLSYITKGVNEGLEPGLKDWLGDPLFGPARKNLNTRRRLEEMILGGHAAHGQNAYFLKMENVIAPKTPLEERLNVINVPTLVIVGELDIAEFQESADILSSGIKGAKKVIIKNAGHMNNMENPDEFNKVLLSFLAEQEISNYSI